jgi:DNA-binding Xre family transcriptional regulator
LAYTVQSDFYLYAVSGIYYVQFRDPVTRRVLSKKSTGLRSRVKADHSRLGAIVGWVAVSGEIIEKLCLCFHCHPNDIYEVVPEK